MFHALRIIITSYHVLEAVDTINNNRHRNCNIIWATSYARCIFDRLNMIVHLNDALNDYNVVQMNHFLLGR